MWNHVLTVGFNFIVRALYLFKISSFSRDDLFYLLLALWSAHFFSQVLDSAIE